MNALNIIKEPSRISTIGFFRHGISGDIYEGPVFVGESCSDGKYRIRMNNLSTLQWEFLDLTDLRNLERVEGVFLRKETLDWKPLPNDPSELSLLKGNLFAYDFKTNKYIPLDVTGNLERVKAYER